MLNFTPFQRWAFRVTMVLGMILSFQNQDLSAQYCFPSHATAGNCSAADLITRVKIYSTSFDKSYSTCPTTSRYFPDTTTSQVTLYRDTGYNQYVMGITTNVAHVISMWIDYNHDFVMTAAEWTDVTRTSTANQETRVTITIPTWATLGNTFMRIRSRFSGNTNGAGDACLTMGSGNAVDYLIKIDTLPSGCPSVTYGDSIFASSGNVACKGQNFQLYLQNYAIGKASTISWQSSSDSTNWNTISGLNGSIVTTNSANDIYYRAITSCGSDADTSNTIFLKSQFCYCVSAATDTADDDIGNVTLGNYSNGADTLPALYNSTSKNTYSDFTGSIADTFSKGVLYPFSVTQINSTTFYASYVGAWIDFNQNGTFETSEKIFGGQTAAGINRNIVGGTVSIPMTAKTGATRMRVVLREGGTATTTQPCGTYNWGETEDYLIYISPVKGIDLAVTSSINPVFGKNCGGNSSLDFTFVLENNGTDSADFSVDSVTLYTEIFDGTNTTSAMVSYTSGVLHSLDTMHVTTTTGYNMSANGTYIFTAYCVHGQDTVKLNDTLRGSVTVFPLITVTPSSPYSQSWESGAASWDTTGSANKSWALGTPAKSLINAASNGSNAWITGGLTGTNYPNNELSALESPCFNLSGMSTTGTRVKFDIWWHTERNWDGVQFQYSTDGGSTWTAVGSFTSPSWYNSNTMNSAAVRTYFNNFTEWFTGNGTTGSNRWLTMQHVLPAAAITSSTRFRFAYGTDGSGNAFNGVAIDNFKIDELPAVDVAVTALTSPTDNGCLDSSVNVSAIFTNKGKDTIDMSVSNLIVKFWVNGSTTDSIADTIKSGVLVPQATLNHTFSKTINFFTVGNYNFMIEAELANDGDSTNDILVDTINSLTPFAIPYTQDFNTTAGIQATYLGSGFARSIGNGVGSTASLRANRTTAGLSQSSTPVVGPIGTQTGFRFSYRTNNVVSSFDSLQLLISTDCGSTYAPLYRIDSANTGGSTYRDVQFSLGAYAGHYVQIRFVASAPNGGFTFDVDNVAFDDIPVVNLGPDQVTCDTIWLNANPNGQNYLVNWSTGSTDDSIYVATTDTIKVSVSTYTGFVARDTIIVTHYSTPVVNLGNDVTICPGSSGVTLSLGSNWPSNYQLLWSTGDTTSSIQVTTPGTYIAAVVTPGGCFGLDTIEVFSSNRPTGVSVIQGSPFKGTFNAGTSTSPDMVCYGDTVTWEMTPPSGFSNSDFGTKWTISNTPVLLTTSGSTPSTGTQTANAPSSSTNAWFRFVSTSAEMDSLYFISVVVQDLTTGCDTTVTRWVKVNGYPTPKLGNDTTICIGANLTLNPGSFASYVWSDGTTGSTLNVSTPGVYTVTVTNASGCSASDTIEIFNFPAVNVNLGKDSTVCIGTSVTFNAGNFASYLWSDGSTSFTLTTSTPGKYWVKVTNSNGCDAYDTVELLNFPAVNVNLGADKTICTGESALLDAGSFASYLWNDGSTSNTLKASNPGKYWVTVKNANGCSGTDTIEVKVNPKPSAGFVVVKNSNASYTFNPNNTTYTSYDWNFGDGSGASTQKNPTYVYTANGNYNVRLIVKDGNGCSDTVTVPLVVGNIAVEELPSISMLNAFPNPFQGETQVQFNLNRTENVTITLMDMTGKVLTQQGLGLRGAGMHQVTLTTPVDNASGIYMLRITAGAQTQVLRLVEMGK